MQTQTSNTLHNAIIEAGSKDRPPMLAPDPISIHNFINMLNTNNTMQTQTSNTLHNAIMEAGGTSNAHHNAIMEAGGKDRPPMLAPDNYVQWKSRIKRYIDTKPNQELIYYCLYSPLYEYKWTNKAVLVDEGSTKTTTKRYMENYKNDSQDIRDQLNA
nr:hypothetical protein [Tanacetum cinerariifolium]